MPTSRRCRAWTSTRRTARDDSEWPGEFPYTRGLYATGYRGRAWTIRQFAGFGNATQTNERYKMILNRGGGGLSVAFDMPTLMGRDSDDPKSLGEVGHCGVAVDSAADIDVLFGGIPLGDVTTSMTISGPAVPVFCMMLVTAERQGADLAKLNGTLQTDIFKEYIAQKEWLFPPEPHLRLIGDLMEYCAEEIPAYKPISVSGYHIREAGSTAAQELAFTLADGFGYVELGLSRGMDVDAFAPGLSFFFDSHLDFFEEIAKFRAARRIWATWLRDVYGAKTEKAQWLRFHTQTAGVSLTAQQPYNNVVRTGVEALAAVLGGTNSLHTNALDETLALPSRAGRRDRTAHAAGDHGGDRRRQRRRPARWLVVRRGPHRPDRGGGLRDLRPHPGQGRLDRLGLRPRGTRRSGGRGHGSAGPDCERLADDQGHPARHRGGLVHVGDRRGRLPVPERPGEGRQEDRRCQLHESSVTHNLEILRVSHEVEVEQVRELSERRQGRDKAVVDAALERLVEAARTEENTIPAMLDACRGEATLGEICDALRSVWGEYREPARF